MSDNSVPLVGNPGNSGRALTTGNGADPLTAMLLRAATDPNFDPAKFEVAVRFLTDRETRQAHSAFNVAMADAATEMQQVPKDASNDYLHSRYATLPGMLSVIKPITAQKGLAFRFGTLPHPDPDWMTVTLILSLGDHEEVTALSGPILSGEGIKGGKTQMNNLQAVGGTVTYLSRYLLGMVFSLIQHMPDIAADNDGGDPTRKPRGSSPASRPPADVKPDTARVAAKYPRSTPSCRPCLTWSGSRPSRATPSSWHGGMPKPRSPRPTGRMIDDMLYARRLELEAIAANEAAVEAARAKAAEPRPRQMSQHQATWSWMRQRSPSLPTLRPPPTGRDSRWRPCWHA